MIIESFDGNLYANILDQILMMQEVPEHEIYSKEFDEIKIEKKTRKYYIPPMEHPWKHASYLNFLNKTKAPYEWCFCLTFFGTFSILLDICI